MDAVTFSTGSGGTLAGECVVMVTWNIISVYKCRGTYEALTSLLMVQGNCTGLAIKGSNWCTPHRD